jgi:GMP synthase (glutamine-hydrolysing)
MKKVLLVTHHEYNDVGNISKILYKNFFLTTVSYQRLNNITKKIIDQFDLIILFGGKMSANSKSKFIKDEYKFISKIIALNKSIIGICLGAQLIAKFFGSRIIKDKSKRVEVGYRQSLNCDKKFFKYSKMNFLQFHNEGICYNKNMNVLAQGRIFEVDAYKIINKNIYGFQFHPEVNSHMISQWYGNLEKIKKGTDKLSNILMDYDRFKTDNYRWLRNTILRTLND